MKSIRNFICHVKTCYKDESAMSIIWLLNLLPKWITYDLLKTGPTRMAYWIFQYILLSYFYVWSHIINNLMKAEGVVDIFQIYVNIYIFTLAITVSQWFIWKREIIRTALEEVLKIDKLSRESEVVGEKYEKYLLLLKRFVYAYYVMNMINGLTLFLPLRIDLSRGLSGDEPCAGFNLATPLHWGLCSFFSAVPDVTIIIFVVDFQLLLLFYIAHSTIMYLLLADEMFALDKYVHTKGNDEFVREKLVLFVQRHISMLKIIDYIKSLYSTPIGVNFALNAGYICLYFYLPLEYWMANSPMLTYTFLLFFCYCFLCQKLANASVVFEQAVYACGWEKFRVADQKIVYVALMLAQRPLIILAADIIPVNMYIFASTLQFIYKLATVFKF